MPSREPDQPGAPSSRGRRPAKKPPGEAGATTLRITLTRSLIGLKPKHVRTLEALGLRKIRAVVRHVDTPAIRGMVAQVPYAVHVEVQEPGGRAVAQGPQVVEDSADGSRLDQMNEEGSQGA